MINKSKWVLGCIFPSCIILHCGSTPLIDNQIQQPLESSNPEEFVDILNDTCIKHFKDILSKQNDCYKKSLSNRSKKETILDKEVEDQKYIDCITTYVQSLKVQISANKQFLKLPKKPKEFLIQKAKYIASLSDTTQQQEYWGNLEFYLAGYAASLLLIVNNTKLEDSEKVRFYKEIIDGFYEAYTIAFKLISGIELKNSNKDENRMDFRSMCNVEQEYKISLFSYDCVGNLEIVVGTPIWIMESLALLKKHPQTGKPATMANIGRGKDVVGANDIQATKGFENNAFLLSFSLNFCDYIRQVIDEINKLLVIYKIDSLKIPKIQEHSTFLFKDFREIIDLQKKDILIFNQMLRKEDEKYFFLYPNKYTKSENNQLSFLPFHTDDNGNYDKDEVQNLKNKRLLFKSLLNIDVTKIGKEIVALANNKNTKNDKIIVTVPQIKTLS